MTDVSQSRETSQIVDNGITNIRSTSVTDEDEEISRSHSRKESDGNRQVGSEISNKYVYSRTKPTSYAVLHLKKLKGKNDRKNTNDGNHSVSDVDSPQPEIYLQARASTLSNQDIGATTVDDSERESPWNHSYSALNQEFANTSNYKVPENIIYTSPRNEFNNKVISSNEELEWKEYLYEHESIKMPNSPTDTELNQSYASLDSSDVQTSRSGYSTGRQSNYKPYKLQDYKRIVQKKSKLGGLGPDKLNSEYQRRQEMAAKQQDYAKSIRQQHAQEKHRWTNSSSKEENDSKQLSKAKLAADYAKNIPKPKPGPKIQKFTDSDSSVKNKKGKVQEQGTVRPNKSQSGTIQAETSTHTKLSKRLASTLKHNDKIDDSKRELSVIELLRQRHERDKLAAAKIKQDLKL